MMRTWWAVIVSVCVLAAAGDANGQGANLKAKRVTLAKRALADAQAALRSGRGSAESVYRWSVRVLDAQRARARSRAKRIGLVRAHLARMTALAATMAAKARSGLATTGAATAAKYYQVEAQLWLRQLKSRRR